MCCRAEEQPPANDAFADAELLFTQIDSALSGSLRGHTFSATNELNEQDTVPSSDSGVWYTATWAAGTLSTQQQSTITFSTQRLTAASFDTIVNVFQMPDAGTGMADLLLLTENDECSVSTSRSCASAVVDLAQAQNFFVRVGGFETMAGAFILDWGLRTRLLLWSLLCATWLCFLLT